MGKRRIIDLTVPIYEGMPNHPFHGRTPVFLSGTLNHRLYQFMERRNPYDGQKLSFQNEMILMCDHTGTHMDAPSHAEEHAESIESIPVDRGYGPGIWLDLSHLFKPRGEITAKDLREAEERTGSRIMPGDIVLIWTGWSTVAKEDPVKYIAEHMGLTKDAADWLRERGPSTVGIDTCSPETVTGVYTSPVHMNFLRPTSLGLKAEEYIAIIENLKDINKIPSPRFQFIGLPLPFNGATGSPIRAIAVIE